MTMDRSNLMDRFWRLLEKNPPPTPKSIEVDYHVDYDWTADMFCLGCLRTCVHRFIEWFPDRVVTAECQECGEESEVK